MFMRGWDGYGEYPIAKAPLVDQVLIDIKITEGFRHLDLLIENLISAYLIR